MVMRFVIMTWRGFRTARNGKKSSRQRRRNSDLLKPLLCHRTTIKVGPIDHAASRMVPAADKVTWGDVTVHPIEPPNCELMRAQVALSRMASIRFA